MNFAALVVSVDTVVVLAVFFHIGEIDLRCLVMRVVPMSLAAVVWFHCRRGRFAALEPIYTGCKQRRLNRGEDQKQNCERRA